MCRPSGEAGAARGRWIAPNDRSMNRRTLRAEVRFRLLDEITCDYFQAVAARMPRARPVYSYSTASSAIRSTKS
jgi:hypothetical protein